MTDLLQTIRDRKILWLLAVVPMTILAAAMMPERAILLFVLSVAAIVPLAALLSHATEAVAARTGDSIGGLLNATPGNLTELIIALTALRAGEYLLVKASIAGAIVTNTLFMMGAAFLIGGLRHKVQEFSLPNTRVQPSLLFLATVALLVPLRHRRGRPGRIAPVAQPRHLAHPDRGLRARAYLLARHASRPDDLPDRTRR